MNKKCKTCGWFVGCYERDDKGNDNACHEYVRKIKNQVDCNSCVNVTICQYGGKKINEGCQNYEKGKAK